jgi:hypothetical protein
MNKRLAVIATLLAAVAAAAGLFANPSNGAGLPGCRPLCEVLLTGAGPSPSTLKVLPAGYIGFDNTDSVTHTVVFANGLCTLTLTPGEAGGPALGDCSNNNFTFYVGSYPYTVDGKFPGKVVTTALRRVVTLTARPRTIRGGARLNLRGQLMRNDQGAFVPITLPVPVIVLARQNSKQPFEPIGTVRARFQGKRPSRYRTSEWHRYGWKLNVRPDVTTTYIARVTTQRLCEFPVSRCAHPHGQVWTNATSRPFTVRVRH